MWSISQCDHLSRVTSHHVASRLGPFICQMMFKTLIKYEASVASVMYHNVAGSLMLYLKKFNSTFSSDVNDDKIQHLSSALSCNIVWLTMNKRWKKDQQQCIRLRIIIIIILCSTHISGICLHLGCYITHNAINATADNSEGDLDVWCWSQSIIASSWDEGLTTGVE